MKLDTKHMRYLAPEDWRVLAAVEQGSKNHELVPTPLIAQLSHHRSGASGVHKCISTLAKVNLISKLKNAKYDGYRLTYGGLDYLALNSHRRSDTVYSIGNQIGVGKESDIYVCAANANATGGSRQLVLKIHRLGRISFRTVKQNRDYLRSRSSGSWMYMSRLAALKEYAFMTALRNNGFPVPEPVGQNRHTVVMSLVDAFPLRQISSVPDPAGLYAELIQMILRLARFGLIHGDFNEFNILIEEHSATSQGQTDNDDTKEVTLKPILIDFPQMVSMDHTNASYYFDRDVACVKRYFERRYHFVCDEAGPFFVNAKKTVGVGEGVKRLDVEVEASGFSRKMAKELEVYMKEVGVDGDANGDVLAEADEEDGDDDGEEADAGGEGEQDLKTAEATGAAQQESETLDQPFERNTEPNADSIKPLQPPDADLLAAVTVLGIQDTQPPPGFLPAVQRQPMKSRTAAKASAGWAI